MAGKYDIVLANGCSFVQGSALGGKALPAFPVEDVPGRFSQLVAEKFNAIEVNIASGGAGNDKIFRTTMEWVDSNLDKLNSSKVLFCLGLTFPQRNEIYLNKANDYVKFNTYEIGKVTERLADFLDADVAKEVVELSKYWLVESYNEDERLKQHSRLLRALLSYIKEKAPLSDVFIFNSLGNYPSAIRTELKLDDTFNPNWNEYLKKKNLKSKEEWHPLEEAHLDMANYIIKKYE